MVHNLKLRKNSCILIDPMREFLIVSRPYPEATRRERENPFEVDVL